MGSVLYTRSWGIWWWSKNMIKYYVTKSRVNQQKLRELDITGFIQLILYAFRGWNITVIDSPKFLMKVFCSNFSCTKHSISVLGLAFKISQQILLILSPKFLSKNCQKSELSMNQSRHRKHIFIYYNEQEVLKNKIWDSGLCHDEGSCRRLIQLITANLAASLAASSFEPRDVQKMQQNLSNVARRCVRADLILYNQYNYGRLTSIKIQRV